VRQAVPFNSEVLRSARPYKDMTAKAPPSGKPASQRLIILAAPPLHCPPGSLGKVAAEPHEPMRSAIENAGLAARLFRQDEGQANRLDL
jgi:hypothetical protein